MDIFNFKNKGFIYSWGDFKSSRYYGFHEGVDFSNVKKGDPVFCEIAGVLDFKGIMNSFGKTIRIKTDLTNIKKEYKNLTIYMIYAHLFDFEQFDSNFIPKGYKIGKVGNSGDCMYYNLKKCKWVKVTKKEQNDEKCSNGTHLHFDVIINQNENTNFFIQDFVNYFKLNEMDLVLKQYFNIYLNPKYILKFLNDLINRNINKI